MKKSILAVLLTLISFASLAGEEIIVHSSSMRASQVVDEFTGKVETCGLYIGRSNRKEAWMLAINSGNGHALVGNAGNYNASGYMMKIDDGDIYEKGSKSRGGDRVFGTLTDNMMNEISKGKKIIIRAYPENRYADTLTSTFDLSGSTKVVQAYKDCVSGL
ncbi:hypothetical protein ACFODT_08875 [Vibrio zhugei]|uniref:Uncharacterized protein n=1 Tax=Vibrio zhugei TaxID=2479546 RepID=A0ABV7C7C4_9VIBR|nr:hypothetical protein [Vibrio zhugei]